MKRKTAVERLPFFDLKIPFPTLVFAVEIDTIQAKRKDDCNERVAGAGTNEKDDNTEAYGEQPDATYLHYFGMDTPSNVKHWAGRKCRSLL